MQREGPACRTSIESLAAAGTHRHRVTVNGEGTASAKADATDDAHHPGRNSGLVRNFSSQNSSWRFIYRHKLLSFLKYYGQHLAVLIKSVSNQSGILPSHLPDEWRLWLVDANGDMCRITQACLLAYFQGFHHRQNRFTLVRLGGCGIKNIKLTFVL